MSAQRIEFLMRENGNGTASLGFFDYSQEDVDGRILNFDFLQRGITQPMSIEQENGVFWHYNKKKSELAVKIMEDGNVRAEERNNAHLLLQEIRDFEGRYCTSHVGLIFEIIRQMQIKRNKSEFISDGFFALLDSMNLFDFTVGTRFSSYGGTAIRRRFFRIFNYDRRFGRIHNSEVDPDYGSRSVQIYNSGAEFRAAEDFSSDGVLREALEVLDERERRIIEMRYLFGDETGVSFRKLEPVFNLSAERIRQIEKEGLQKMRNYFLSKGIDEFE